MALAGVGVGVRVGMPTVGRITLPGENVGAGVTVGGAFAGVVVGVVVDTAVGSVGIVAAAMGDGEGTDC
jgi:hypothetical protein